MSHESVIASTTGKAPATRIRGLLDQHSGLWRGSDMMARKTPDTLSSGYPALDRLLPHQGWPRQGLVEIISREQGIGELQLLIPLLRALGRAQHPMLWITPPCSLYAPALLQAGVDTRHIVLIRPQETCQQALWSTEKALQSSGCALVLLWQNWLSTRVMRRLQLAAQSGNTLGILFHRRPAPHSPASLQLQIQAAPAGGHEAGDSGTERIRELDVSLLKARGSHLRGSQARVSLHG